MSTTTTAPEVAPPPTAPATPVYEWRHLPWKQFERRVFKLQKRIFRASRRGDTQAVHRLERLLMRSWSARCLAVRRVTQDNRGKHTAGVDGVKSLTPLQRLALVATLRPSEKPRPVRRVWIPKPGKAQKRPLGIPTLRDRAAQTLVRLALEPEWEARFEPNSYGFRPGRLVHDAIEAIFTAIRYTPKYVFDADIAGCFDNIDHAAPLRKLGTFPALRRVIRGWLKAGVWDGVDFKPTESGTPQGGALSPLLANMALHGLETHLRMSFKNHFWKDGREHNSWRPTVVRYADLCRHRHRSAYAGRRVMPTPVGARSVGRVASRERSASPHRALWVVRSMPVSWRLQTTSRGLVINPPRPRDSGRGGPVPFGGHTC